MKRVCLILVAVLAGWAGAMPTASELAKVRPLAKELTEGMDAAAAAGFVAQAETEAQRYVFVVRAAELYLKAKNYDAAAAMLESLYIAIADMKPAQVVEEIQELAKAYKVSGKMAPRLLSLQKRSRALDQSLRDKKADKQVLAELRASVGQWDKALEIFSALTGKCAEVAGDEVSKKELVSVADFWWTYKPVSPIVGATFKRHAVKLYRACLDDGTVTAPFKVALLQKRIEEFSAVESVTRLQPLSTIGVKEPLPEAKAPKATEGLVHRWSFNGDFHDSVGGAEAFTGGGARLENGQCVLNQGWITLNDAAASFNGDFTLEIWTTENERSFGGRVFRMLSPTTRRGDAVFGWATGEAPEGYFHADNNRITWGRDKGGFDLGVETYLAVTCRAVGDHCVITAYRYSYKKGVLGEHVARMNKADRPSVTSFDLGARICSGRRFINSISSFNECRVWKRSLSKEEILRSVKAGPDKLGK